MIESPSNPKFKLWRSLLETKGQQKAGLFLLSGRKTVPEVLERWPRTAQTLLLAPHHQVPPEWEGQITNFELKPKLFRELDEFGTDFPLLVCQLPEMPPMPWSEDPRGPELVLALSDPSNLGAVLRSAVNFGVSRVALLKGCSSPYHPKALRSGSNAAFQLEFFDGGNWGQVPSLDGLYGLDLEGERMDQCDLPKNLRFVLGEEGQGLPQDLKIRRLTIPTTGRLESLNAAVAASVVLYQHFVKHFCLILLFAGLTLGGLPAHTHDLKPEVQEVASQLIRLHGQDLSEEALNVARSSFEAFASADEDIRVPLGSLLITQLINHQQFSQAAEILLLLLRERPDVSVHKGFFSFGQMASWSQLMKALVQSEHFEKAIELSEKTFELRPTWKQEAFHEMGGSWTSLGRAHFRTGNSTQARWAWKNARAAFDSKSELWRQAAPETFSKTNGLDRFNPFQIEVEALLLVHSTHIQDLDTAHALRADWEEQKKVLREFHADEDDFPAKMFGKFIRSNIKDAREFLGLSDSTICEDFLIKI